MKSRGKAADADGFAMSRLMAHPENVRQYSATYRPLAAVIIDLASSDDFFSLTSRTRAAWAALLPS